MKDKKGSLIERIGQKIPDPVVIFIGLYLIVFALTAIFGGYQFELTGADATTQTVELKNMLDTENVRWIFNNALLGNWLGFSNGIIGVILIVMFGVGIAEESGLLSSVIRVIGNKVSDRLMPFMLVLLGILSNIATDAGYLILIPLAGLLYVGMKKNPIIGMAAAFAGVSAGFSANLVPATVVDAIIGTNAKAFAESQGVPFVSYTGQELNPMLMHYLFMVASTVLLVVVGGFVTIKFIKPRFENQTYELPDDLNPDQFKLTDLEKRGLKFAGIGVLVSAAVALVLFFGPLADYVDESGNVVTPFLNNIILIVTLVFFIIGAFYGFAVGKFKNAGDLIKALSKQLGSMGYVLVLTFFSYNFLAMLTYSNVGTYITYIGAEALRNLGLQDAPILLIIGFILITALINLFVGGLTAKWMLLGPIFIPMLYSVNQDMTPDVVSAAYRIADSSTNIITPLMTYAGVILVYMRKYMKNFTIGNLISTMVPYSISFLVCWTILFIIFFIFKIPLGF